MVVSDAAALAVAEQEVDSQEKVDWKAEWCSELFHLIVHSQLWSCD